MINIIKNHSLKVLGNQLAEDLAKAEVSDPFVPVRMMVPNLETSRWLKLFLAEQNGFSGNIEFMLPAEWQWKQIRILQPDLPKLLPSDPMPMTWSLFSLLRDDKIRSAFPELQFYINRDNESSEERAAWQLARQIAAVFDQYLVYRPEMILNWQKQGSRKQAEAWQSSLWRILDKGWKKLDASLLTKNKAELYFEIFEAAASGLISDSQPLYVFNPGLIPVPVLKLMKEYGKNSDILFYVVRPSCDLARGQLENELLQSFADEALDTSEAAEEILEVEGVDSEPVSIPENSNLIKIQNAIVRDKKIPHLEEKDDSIHIRSCHSELREVETLHSFLLDCFQSNPDVSPDDVLVVMPDPDRYAPFINAVFGTFEPGLPHIPFYLGSRHSDSAILQTFEHLLTLPESRFTFEDIMDFVQMPVVLKAFDIPPSSVDMLKKWFRENHVKWGLDGRHRKEEDQPEQNLQTWKEALKRGWMGQLAGGDPGSLNNGSLVYSGINSRDQQQAWAAFSKLVHKLGSIRKEIRTSKPVSRWADIFERWMEYFIHPDDLSSRESLKLITAIEKIRKESETSGDSQNVSFSIIRSVLSEAMQTAGAGSAMFTRGVVFSSMVPVRSIPFKVVALLGLNDDQFPRKPDHPDFDLMARNPKKGERNRKNEDRNLFLESILSAGKIHYCSYIGRSQKDDEVIPPSPILAEWLDILGKAGQKSPKFWLKTERLFAFSPAYFADEPASWSGLNLETAKSIGKGDGHGLKLEKSLPEPEILKNIELTKLERFYNNPVKGFLTGRLGVRLSGTDEESEEFSINGLETHILLQRVFGWMINGMAEAQARTLLLQSGALPAGWQGERKLQEIMEQVQRAFSELEKKFPTIECDDINISIPLQESKLVGTVRTYSKDKFLDVNPSKFSGKVLFQSWIRHLCMCAQSSEMGNSILLCSLKKTNINWLRFLPVENPNVLLEDLLKGYMEGMLQPLMFFPKTAYEYAANLPDEKSARKAAESVWDKTNWRTFEKIGENTDPYISLILGSEAEIQVDAWKETFTRFMQPLLNHMEEI